jgi:DNA polymerase-3 subunit alpha
MKPVFLDGCVEHGVERRVAEQVFERMEKFSRYGFNKSHSTGYALVAYWTAYLKAHYRAEFLAAQLSTIMDDSSEVAKYITDCRRSQIEVLPPDVSRSAAEFRVVDGSVLWGLTAIKNVGGKTAEAIVADREANGPFGGLWDFCRRIPSGAATRSTVEILIRAGAFDAFGERNALIRALKTAAAAGQKYQQDAAVGQGSLFDMGGGDGASAGDAVDERLPDVEPMSEQERRDNEKEYLGLFVTSHPLLKRAREIEEKTTAALEELEHLQAVVVGGMVGEMRSIITKRGEEMTVLKLQGAAAELDVTVFPRTYAKCRELLVPDALVVIEGKLERRGEEPEVELKLLADGVKTLDDAGRPSRKRREAIEQGREAMAQERARRQCVRIDLPGDLCQDRGLLRERLHQLRSLFGQHQGPTRVVLKLCEPEGPCRVLLPDRVKVDPTPQLTQAVTRLLGEGTLHAEAL